METCTPTPPVDSCCDPEDRTFGEFLVREDVVTGTPVGVRLPSGLSARPPVRLCLERKTVDDRRGVVVTVRDCGPPDRVRSHTTPLRFFLPSERTKGWCEGCHVLLVGTGRDDEHPLGRYPFLFSSFLSWKDDAVGGLGLHVYRGSRRRRPVRVPGTSKVSVGGVGGDG